jgi:hypothetical protein
VESTAGLGKIEVLYLEKKKKKSVKSPLARPPLYAEKQVALIGLEIKK